MWNIVNPFGMGQLGPAAVQKRNLGILHLANLNIAPGKCFTNPNFVNKDHQNFNSCRFDKSARDRKILNSSPETTDPTDEMKLPPPPPSHTDNNTKNKRRNKRNRRKRRRKCANKNNPKRDLNKKEIEDMMETNSECDTPLNNSDTPIHPQALCLNDFLTETRLEESSPDFCTIISMTPISSTFFCRPRQLSITESEDSFIVFDSGTDESTEIGSDSESDSTDVEGEDDVDSSFNALPTKRVRFADDNELCEVHPMVKWSFAYHQARIGPWEKYARDRDRFSKRIRETEKTLLPIFNDGHRERIFKERFEN